MENIKEETLKAIGKSVAEYLKERGMSQKKAAELSGVDAQTVCDITRGVYRVGKLNAQRLHDTFGFDIEFLRNGIGTLLPAPLMKCSIATGSGYQELLMENERLKAELERCKLIIEKQKIAIAALNELS